MNKIIIDGENVVLGRLSSYAAKEVLKGSEIIIVNSEKVVITGNKKNIEEDYRQKRGRVGTIQVGPKFPRQSYMIVKRTIRGMLPNHREGRGREAIKKIKCFNGVPKEYENKEKIKLKSVGSKKFVPVSHISK